jgi:hypothetical protein
MLDMKSTIVFMVDSAAIIFIAATLISGLRWYIFDVLIGVKDE